MSTNRNMASTTEILPKAENAINSDMDCITSELIIKDEGEVDKDPTYIPSEISADVESANESDCPSEVVDDEHEMKNIFPKKSRARCEDVYTNFVLWKKRNKKTSNSEDVLLSYFQDSSQSLRPSSLVSRYFMLRSSLSLKYNMNISKYRELREFIRRIHEGYPKKKMKRFTREEIQTFLDHAPDYTYLLMKTIFIIGTSGACRKLELRNIKPADILDTGKSLIITVKDFKTEPKRSFEISDSYYSICKKYIGLRPPEITEAFFLKYANGKCSKEIIGINKIGSVPKQIAKYLRIPDADEYSGHCFTLNYASKLDADDVSSQSCQSGDTHGSIKIETVDVSTIKDPVCDVNNKTVTINNKITRTKSTNTVTSFVINDNVAEFLNSQFVFNNCTVVINNYHKKLS